MPRSTIRPACSTQISSLVDKVKAGSAIDIEFVERKPGEWVITKLDARAK